MWNAECEMRNGCATVDSAFRTPHSALASVLNVALTGNIAAGKSTVVNLFRRWGATIIDADVLVREAQARSEEHTSELQSRLHLVCRLLLEKKKPANLWRPRPIVHTTR